MGLPAASGHSACSPALCRFTLPLSFWACQPLPGTQHARPHFTASLFHPALGLASRFRALSMLARTLQHHSSTQPLGLPAASGHSACSPALCRFTLPLSPWAYQPLPGTQHARPHYTASLFHSALGHTSHSAASMWRIPQARPAGPHFAAFVVQHTRKQITQVIEATRALARRNSAQTVGRRLLGRSCKARGKLPSAGVHAQRVGKLPLS